MDKIDTPYPSSPIEKEKKKLRELGLSELEIEERTEKKFGVCCPILKRGDKI